MRGASARIQNVSDAAAGVHIKGDIDRSGARDLSRQAHVRGWKRRPERDRSPAQAAEASPRPPGKPKRPARPAVPIPTLGRRLRVARSAGLFGRSSAIGCCSSPLADFFSDVLRLLDLLFSSSAFSFLAGVDAIGLHDQRRRRLVGDQFRSIPSSVREAVSIGNGSSSEFPSGCGISRLERNAFRDEVCIYAAEVDDQRLGPVNAGSEEGENIPTTEAAATGCSQRGLSGGRFSHCAPDVLTCRRIIHL